MECSKYENELKEELRVDNNLKESKCRFDNFIVGQNNEFAYNMAKDIAENNTEYNFLFIYGNNGVGKTHLLYAIRNKLLENNTNVLYITSNQFTSQLIDSIKEGKLNLFRDKYKNIDFLVIDDIQFIAGKERIQKEFYYIFNFLYDNGSKIVISSDKNPEDIAFLEDRLKYRLKRGIIAKISDYDYEKRLEILKSKAKIYNVTIDEEILSIMAKKVTSNIMDLEGVLKTAVEYYKKLNKQIDTKIVDKIFKDRGM